MIKYLYLSLFILCFNYTYCAEKKDELSNIQNQIIKTYEKIIKKEKQIENLDFEINRSKQKQEILKKRIKDNENILENIFFIMKKKKQQSDFLEYLKSFNSNKRSIVTQNLVTESIYQLTKEDVNYLFESFSVFKENEIFVFEKKKKMAYQKKKLQEFKVKLDIEITKKNLRQESTEKKKITRQQKVLKGKVKNFDDLVKATAKKRIIGNKREISHKVRYPVVGKIISNFGQSKDYLTKNGILFQPKKGSYIISPISGRVKWAENLKGHGNVLIIDNEDGYHSIITGVEKIITEVGSEVLIGEPIAKDILSDEKPKNVYFELRFKGKIVDPKRRVEIL
ncbi:MAG: hypothetical protein CMM96_03800 [Rickettsiales bacterium]|nr:hypothetical protein [Rickettsiales bacterium]